MFELTPSLPLALAAETKANLVGLAYLVSIFCFIVGIKRLNRVRTARSGNAMAAGAMILAIVATLFHANIVDWGFVIAGLAAGTIIGAGLAYFVDFKQMPEMVAFFNGSGGAASFMVALSVLAAASFFTEGTTSYAWTQGTPLAEALIGGASGSDIAITLTLSVIIGGITLSGSMVAWAKLSGKIWKDLVFPGQHFINLALLLAMFGLAGYLSFGVENPSLGFGLGCGLVGFALIMGVMLVMPIGGADMPVVISLLNSYSGIAAAMTGFVLRENVLIVSGAMVGAAGLILTAIMCKAMNRSLINVLMGGFGQGSSGPSEDARDYKNIKETTPEELAMMLDGITSLIIVPGYGLAVAQAQHAVRELADYLHEKHEVEVRYAIHPVAGRMPGHMNVLLAESNVPYEQLLEMDEINSDFKTTDMAIVLGANDVVNPAAIDDPNSPLAGMPILLTHEARNVIVVKRSLSPGYAGVKNPLFERDNAMMLFSDAKKAIQETLNELKEAA